MWVLVIVVVAAVGMGLVQPWWAQKRGQEALTECKGNLKNLGTAMEAYSIENGGRFPSPLSGGGPLRLPEAIVPRFLDKMPICPVAGTDTYSRSSWGAYNPDAYTIVCGGHHHAERGQGPNFPQYSSTLGLISQ